ncbi:MAG: hypothetical protein HY236_15085 [Acidobacteria bacterium]|nr:hypothetical protein [Acidobacteriota bacterium]
MSRISRREFAKLAGGAALVAPLAGSALGEPLVSSLGWTQEAPKKPDPPPGAPAKPAQAQPPQQGEPAKPEPKPKLTPEQEDAVKKAIERRERQLESLRSRTLPYDAEPAFVFQVRQRLRGARM